MNASDPLLGWHAYLTRLFQSVRLPPEHHDEDCIVGDAHGIDADGHVMKSEVTRHPDGTFTTAEPMYAVYRFTLPGR